MGSVPGGPRPSLLPQECRVQGLQRRRLLCGSVLTIISLGLSGTQANAAAPKPRPWAYGHQLEVGKKHAALVRAHQHRNVLAPGEEEGDEDEAGNIMEQ